MIEASAQRIAKLNAAIVDALADPAIGQRLADIEIEDPSRDEQTPEALGALQRANMEK
jgi:hypothetical protein